MFDVLDPCPTCQQPRIRVHKCLCGHSVIYHDLKRDETRGACKVGAGLGGCGCKQYVEAQDSAPLSQPNSELPGRRLHDGTVDVGGAVPARGSLGGTSDMQGRINLAFSLLNQRPPNAETVALAKRALLGETVADLLDAG